MTSTTVSENDETFANPKTMPYWQREEVRRASLQCDISKLIPLVSKRLEKEGYGKLGDIDIAYALSRTATERLNHIKVPK